MLQKRDRIDYGKNMRSITGYYRHILVSFIKACLLVLVASTFFMPSIDKSESDGYNMYQVTLNGKPIGAVEDLDRLDECMKEARKNVLDDSETMTLIETDLQYEGKQALFGFISGNNSLTENIEAVMQESISENMHQAFTVKIKDYTVNLESSYEVMELLQAAVAQYDMSGYYRVQLLNDADREVNVLTAEVNDMTPEETMLTGVSDVLPQSGVYADLLTQMDAVEAAGEKDFSEYYLGLTDMAFGDEVEVVECYLPTYELTDLATAIDQVTKKQEKSVIYEVQSGDSLSKIANDNDMTVADLLAVNASVEDEFSTIRVGDELTITVPEPELSVIRQEQSYYEESYDAEVIYVDNDEWYTTQTQTLQEPIAGYHKVVALVTYRNDEVTDTEIVKEEVVVEAVPKIVERGTITPPTYIKPLSGGRLSSYFGQRSSPTRGASSNHKGVDWSTPVGTAVMASSGGTVVKAGWARGYGYVIYINHPDGRQTRYAHLSRVLVSSGQSVSQGEKIALSGNTGISTGPHVHFEMLIGGTNVNPLKYLN